MPDDALSIVLGGVIAGLVGLVAVFAQQWAVSRQWVWDHVLGPFYDFARGVTENPMANYWGVNPWVEVGWHDRMKIGRRLRARIEEFSSVVSDFHNAEADFNNHLGGRIHDRLKDQTRTLLGNFVDGDQFRWERFGKEGGGYWYFDPFFEAFYRETVRNPTSPEDAIGALAQRKPESWGLVTAGLELMSPGTLKRVHDVFVADESFERSKELGRRADDLRTAAIQRAKILRKVLERRAS